MFIFITIFTLLMTSKGSYILESQLDALKSTTPHINLSKVSNRTQTIVLNTNDGNRDILLQNWIPTGCDKSVRLIINDNISKEPIIQEKFTRFIRQNSNIVLIIEKISSNLDQYLMIKHINQWSLLYIIVTTKDDTFKCDNGEISEVAYERTNLFLKNLWQNYHIADVLVTFPMVCPLGVITYVGKNDTNKESYDRNVKIMLNKTSEELIDTLKNCKKDLSIGYPLRTNMFERFPTSITKCEDFYYYIKENYTNSYCGLDGMVMHEILKYFKFKVISSTINNYCNDYGYLEPNGTISGSLGCVVRNEMDISLNSRFMERYLNGGFVFLHHITSDSLCALVRSPRIVPLWHYPYNANDLFVWSFIISVLVTVGTVMWTTKLLIRQVHERRCFELQAYILDSITTGFFGISLTKSATFRTVRASFLFCSIILSTAYQGHINYVFTTLTRYDAVTTLSDLYGTGTIVYTSPSTRTLLEPSSNSFQKDLLTHVRVWPNVVEVPLEYVLKHRQTATIMRCSDVLLETLNHYVDNEGYPLLHVVEECIRTYYLSYIARTDFPFTHHLEKFLMHLLEAGLPARYYQWTQQALHLHNTSRKSSSVPRPIAKISLGDQRIAFYMLIFGHIVSILIFIGEMLWAKKFN